MIGIVALRLEMNVADPLTARELDNLTQENDPPAFVLWFKPDRRRTGWEVVSRHPPRRLPVPMSFTHRLSVGCRMVLSADTEPDR